MNGPSPGSCVPVHTVLLAASLVSPSAIGVRVLQRHQVAGTRQFLLWRGFYLGVQTLNVWICTSLLLAPFLISGEGKEEAAFLRHLTFPGTDVHPRILGQPVVVLEEQAKPRSHKWTPEPRNAPPYYSTCLFKQTKRGWWGRIFSEKYLPAKVRINPGKTMFMGSNAEQPRACLKDQVLEQQGPSRAHGRSCPKSAAEV